MTDDRRELDGDEELTDAERDWLGRVPASIEPPPGLRAGVVAALTRSGSLRSAPRRRSALLRIAAGLALAFVAGGIIGRGTAPDHGPGAIVGSEAGASYVLLLYEDATFRGVGIPEADLVAEYSDWAGTLAGRGALVAGEKLADGERAVAGRGETGAVGDGVLSGFFIVRADDLQEAERIAQESPHVAYGGRIVIRRIDPT